MPNRYASYRRTETNRTQRKARWIRAKNDMSKYPDCAYNGDFYCNHVYDPENPWVWVDFRFFHTRLKRYFAVAMTTCEYDEYEKIENDAWSIIENPRADSSLVKVPGTDYYTFDEEYHKASQEAYEKRRTLVSELAQNPVKTRPLISVRDYGPVAVGVFAVVNKQHIDESVIREFIHQYRSLGEPTAPGFIWYGEEIEVVPGRIEKRL